MKMTFDVYGRKLTVEPEGTGWRVWLHGAEGRRRPADDIQIPQQLGQQEIQSYLADLCHEWATERHPDVIRLN